LEIDWGVPHACLSSFALNLYYLYLKLYLILGNIKSKMISEFVGAYKGKSQKKIENKTLFNFSYAYRSFPNIVSSS
jgi:hypothetical protein